ncbi:helix-turn-helix transcriptional regulator [Sinomonas susongensis]|uniref:helix-turn-helix transcriptional regulator n=1 Tax=Sinomonas susongensis TaxID=1324851 RepID=UPI001107D91E|nr:helix-turn-helix domain-containing protein [Sinomonas susongensis]
MKVKDPAMLRRWRRQENLSQAQLAFLVNRSQTTIHLLETGGMCRLSEGLAIALAVRLKRPWDELFELEENERLSRGARRRARLDTAQAPPPVASVSLEGGP